MSIEEIRSSLNSDDLKEFDNNISNFHMGDNVIHEIIDFNTPTNFVLKSTYNTKPYIGLVLFNDGKISTCVGYFLSSLVCKW